MLYYDIIDISKGIDPTKSNKSRECMICHFKIMYAMVVRFDNVKR